MKTLLIPILLLAAAAYTPTDVERARWTYHDMRSIQTCLEAYATDHSRYPEVKTIGELVHLVQPIYISNLPTHDAWGNAYRIDSSASTYRIVSAGADGTFDPSTWSTAAKDLPVTADAVIDHGKVIRMWSFK